MSYKLFLDDVMEPSNCLSYMHTRIGAVNPIYAEGWVTVRSYDEFVKWIEKFGLPTHISFDHDLADEHYDFDAMEDTEKYKNLYNKFKTKTGYDAAKWLVEYCSKNNKAVPICFIHSMNPAGCDNIKNVLNTINQPTT